MASSKIRGDSARNQRSGSAATRQLLQANAFLSQALAERDIGQSRQSAKISNAPALEYFQKLDGVLGCPPSPRKQNFQRKIAQLLGFLSFGNHDHAGKAVSGQHGRIRIGGHGNVGFETEIASAACHITRNFRQRTEKRFQAGEIQKDSVAARIFHPWRE